MGHFWYSVQQFESGIPRLDGRCAFTVARHLSDNATVGNEATHPRRGRSEDTRRRDVGGRLESAAGGSRGRLDRW